MAVNISELFTKIILRNDTPEAWATSTIVLEKGEPALEIDLEKGIAKFKIGDGKGTFNTLPYSTATPDEVQSMIDTAIKNAGGSIGGVDGAVTSVVLATGTKNGTLKLTVNDVTVDNIEVAGLGSAAFTNVSDYATSEQGKKADSAMALKGVIKSIPTTSSIGDTYKIDDNITITADISYTGSEVKVVSGDLIVAMADNKWIAISCGAVEEAKSLTEGISATVSGGVIGSASAANAGENMEINITEVNTDYLKLGEKELIINGGSAN